MKKMLASFKTKLFFLSVFVFLFCIPKAFSYGACEGAFFASILLRKIEYTSLSPHIKRALKRSGRNLVYVGDVAVLTERDLSQMGLGARAVDTIKNFLLENNTHLNIGRNNWPLTAEQQKELKSKLAFMDIERMAEPEEVEVLKTIWVANPQVRHFHLEDPKEMMKKLRAYRDKINNIDIENYIETVKAEWGGELGDRALEGIGRLEQLKKMLGEPVKMELTPVLVQPVSQFQLPVNVKALLRSHDIVYIGDLVILKEWKLFEMLNYSDNYLLSIKRNLSAMNLHLGMQVGGWRPGLEKIRELEEMQSLSREDKQTRKDHRNNNNDIRELEYVFVVPVVEILNNIRNALGNRLTKKVEEIFAQEDIVYIGDLVSRTEQQLLAIPGIGPVIVNEVKRALSRKEKFERNRIFFSGTLHLGMQIEGWRPGSEKIRELTEQESRSRRSERY